MFKLAKYFIIVANSSFVIINENDLTENIIEFQTYIPNVPFYHHLFDENNNDIMKLTNYIKSLKMKDILVIMPDDTLDIFADKKILEDYFYTCKAKKVEIKFQSLLLSQYDFSYISISKTTRNLVIHYIIDGKSCSKKYYDRDYSDIDQIKRDMKKIHADCANISKPVYINNVNKNMDFFQNIGYMVSSSDIIKNVMKGFTH